MIIMGTSMNTRLIILFEVPVRLPSNYNTMTPLFEGTAFSGYLIDS